MSPTLTVLGVETSCDETAAAVVRLDAGGRAEVRSSIVASQAAVHADYGGVVPEIAARGHVEVIDTVIARAMAEAGIGFGELDGIAATAGPGLVGGVMVGLSAAKAIALARGLPLIAVNHLEGHAVSVRLAEPMPYPFLLLLVSGGHCQLLAVEGIGQCTRLGSTIDDAAGEAFDKIGASLGLPYPGGPALERLAEGGDAARFALPRALLGRAGFDFSFSGLKTAAARMAEAEVGNENDRRDLAASVQAAIARQLTERSARAMQFYKERFASAADPLSQAVRPDSSPMKGEQDRASSPFMGEVASKGSEGAGGLRLVVAGGVAANGAVRASLQAAAEREGFSFAAPPLKYCTDNAAMIALAGAERLAAGITDPLDAPARPRWPLDEAAAKASPTHVAGRKGAKA